MTKVEEDLFDMSDEDLEAAFKEAKAAADSPDTAIEEDDDNAEEVVDPSEEEIEATSDDEIDEDNGSDQLNEDSDDNENESEESEEEEISEEDQSDTEDETLDEDSETEDDDGSDDKDSDVEDKQPAQTYTFKANGKEYEFSSEEIVDQFPKIFGQAMDYTKKMQAIKPWRKTIDALESAELSHKDVSLMIDVLKGDKDAITEVIKRTGVDTLELDTDEESNYVAKDYGRDDQALAIKDVVDVISQDPEYSVTQNILSKEWDEQSWSTMASNPEMIRLLHLDVKSGMYKQLQPIAEKLKVFSGGTKSDLEYYKEAAQQYYAQRAKQEADQKRQETKKAEKIQQEAEAERVAQVKAKSAKRSATKQASAKRKAAAPTKNIGARKGVVDYLEDSDEAFEEWYKNLQDSM